MTRGSPLFRALYRGWERLGGRWAPGILSLIALIVLRDEVGELLDRPIGTTVTMVLLAALAVLGGAVSWALLFDSSHRRDAMIALIAVQPSKYLPVGGVLQVASQTARVSSLIGDRAAIELFAVHAVVQAIAALAVAAFWPLSGVPLIAVVATLAIAALSAVVLCEAIGRLLRHRLRAAVVRRERLILSSILGLVPMVLYGVVLSMLLEGGTELESLRLIGAFSAAWLGGFIVFPVPAGAGIREVLLVAALGGSASQVVAASVVLRVVAFVAEFLLGAVAVLVGGTSRGDR